MKSNHASTQSVNNYSTYIKLSLVAIIWGGTFVAGRYISVETPPLLSASLRFILAGITLIIFLVLSGKMFVKINLSQLLKIIGLGLCGIYAYNLFFFYGLHHTTASRASLIVALNPAVMAIFSYFFYKERQSSLKILGIILCLLGAMIVIFSKTPQLTIGEEDNWLGDTLIFGCVLSWVAYSVFCKNIVNQIGPLHTVTYSILAGAIMLTVTAIFTGQMSLSAIHALSMTDLSSLLYLGAVGSAVAYIWYYDGIQRIGSTRSGVFIALNPLTAVLLGAVLLDERLTFPMFIGGALVIGGILICNKRSTGKKLIPHESKFEINHIVKAKNCRK
ncbi:EamA family transporter [Photorhabdus luminescens]|uniref:DMT family transporter n=1 Tax=Photorhabdus TaxID=29487 RepID=UPI000CF98D36|nr:DMT family transporter [Photorhabdus aegyptia]MCC8457884.1 DMT family transporter [Photorhabdus aegyptia]PQQ31360.1 EamA family transporter [Photorhabdus luminescens]PQQ34725.1 EamA family transporter [Photorhabdus luminescens]